MNEKLILQIGRLDNSYQRNIKFVFGSSEYSQPLSSLAFKQHFIDTAKLILLYPVSIALNDSLKSKDDDDFISQYIIPLIHDKEKRDEYLQCPDDILKQHPHSKQAHDVFVIHSLGRYLDIDFTTSMHDIVLLLWSLLIKEYKENNFKEE